MEPEIVKKLWDKYNLQRNVRAHCRKVAEVAMEIAEKVEKRGLKVDKEAILIGSLLHDIGRALTHDPFQHFLRSAEILRKEGLDEKIVLIAERHFSAGISKEEAKRLGLPEKDFLPLTLEEKIVSFADNIVFGSERRSVKDFLEMLEGIDAENPELRWLTEKTRERIMKMKEELEKLSGMNFD